VTGADLVEAAVAELYSADPDEFVERRGVLAARARAAGDAAAAKRIAALRKPTRSAWVVNQLARSAPGAVSGLAGLGEQLREAQRSSDGEALRALSQRRHQLVGTLVRQALAVTGQHSPSAALRDEVTATLGAAVADPQVAGQLAAGTLDRAVHREGFGPAGVLTVVTSQPGRPKTKAAPAEDERKRREAAAAEAEDERRRSALVAAEDEAAEADRAAEAATAAERDQETAVERLEEELAQARQRLAHARLQARRARAGQRRARQALDRMRR
jgi:hypothetical protein